MNDIMTEYSQLPQTSDHNLSLEGMGNGDVKVTLEHTFPRGDRSIAQRVIKKNESLDFIKNTFAESLNFTRDMDFASVKMAYFVDANLYIEHEDGSAMTFKVRKEHREEVKSFLKDKLTTRFIDKSK